MRRFGQGWSVVLLFGTICFTSAIALGDTPQAELGEPEGLAPLPTPPTPSADDKIGAPAVAGCDGCCSGSGGFDWTKSKYRYQKTFWPLGFATNLPTGPGYYSLFDQVHGEYRDAPPKYGYPRFFANPVALADYDFSYVDAPGYQPTLIESLHRIHLGDNWMVGTGGEYRNRFDGEGNSRLTGTANNFDLSRIQVFGEIWYKDMFRFHVDFIDAQTTQQSLKPLLTDRNFGDILNAFVDVKTLNIGDEALYTRVGRQQITLGSQRIISISDWTNTERTFEGVRSYRRSDNFDVDLFWLQPVIPNATKYDQVDSRQNFAGVYTTYRPNQQQILDLYYLFLNNNDSPADAKANAVGALQNTPYDVHTLGYRYAGKGQRGFLWDSENLVQVGRHNDTSIFAANFTNGIGWHFKDLPMNPTFWAHYDYATGSSTVNGSNTFNQLYPLGHYYLGWMDYIGRANIQDINFHAYLYPTNWITFNVQYHIFYLANSHDALYNTAAAVIRSDPTGAAGNNVGQETDFIVNWHVSPRSDIVTAYGHFFAGSFLKNTGPTNNMDTVWLLYNVRW